ncbi:MAG: hypothetical protein KGI90_12045 [Burkholderiales bacterium]|nr:hypothetical protein [Burkholderiales bacterium]MDE2277201.1 hypothetical protein [Burkholderiales bacterium]
MKDDGLAILACLEQVGHERALRAADPVLAARVAEVKAWQRARFTATYADLLADPRHAPAARFFLDELYGPGDFSTRDDQFARIVPALVRLFSAEVVATVRALAQLHALSEQLDSAMAMAVVAAAAQAPRATATPLTAPRYAAAWRAVGRAADRERQIELLLAVGRALDQHTRRPLLRQALRLMRKPAEAAGLGALQHFLETGFDTFRAMHGADDFLSLIAQRERALAAQLFGT